MFGKHENNSNSLPCILSIREVIETSSFQAHIACETSFACEWYYIQFYGCKWSLDGRRKNRGTSLKHKNNVVLCNITCIGSIWYKERSDFKTIYNSIIDPLYSRVIKYIFR